MSVSPSCDPYLLWLLRMNEMKKTHKRKKLIRIDWLNKRGQLKCIIATISRWLVLCGKQIIVVGWCAIRQTWSYV